MNRYWGWFLAAIVWAFSIGMVVGRFQGRNDMRREAVMVKAAQWYGDYNTGKAIFRWLPDRARNSMAE